ncbi:MAG: F0F1 ATP synthase subunit B [Pseudomonadales bacterium]|nr:F0F1 ATP synthase subunit B [Pseudomonadales bacterium]
MNINLTLFGQIITFAVFVWFCMRFVWPPIRSAMEEREKKMADGLEAADRASRDLELAKENIAEKLREAKAQAAEIIDQANKRANQLVEEAKQQAREEGSRIVNAAQAEVEQEYKRAREELRSKVSELSVIGAEKILQGSVDRSQHSEMLARLASEL